MDLTEVIERLRWERDDLDGRIRALQDRQDKIDTTIATLVSLDTDSDQAERVGQTERTTATVTSTGRQVTSHSELPIHVLRGQGPQALLRHLLRERPGLVVDSKSAYDLLVNEAGWESEAQDAVNVVRSALAQLYKTGDLVRQGRGKYLYRPHEGPEPTRPDDLDGDMFAMTAAEPEGEDRRGHDPFAPAPVPSTETSGVIIGS